MADVALAGRVIASHYAEPVERRITSPTELRRVPDANCEAIRQMKPGELFWLLDDSVGWAWGYAGDDRHVGYVPSNALGD